jgi:peroxiredoxin
MGPSQNKFKELVGAKDVTFLSDIDAVVVKRFGAFNDATKGVRRFYFLIDEQGTVLWRSVNGTLLPFDKLMEDLTAAVKK